MARARDPYQMAQFKFGLIAPLVQKTYPDATATAYCRRIAAMPLKLPDGTERMFAPNTLKMWAALYESGGMDALVRPPRRDMGATRALGADAAVRIRELKTQFPKLPATQVRLRLLEEGLSTSKVSARCVQRFVKDWESKHGPPAGAKDRKAFEAEYFESIWQADSCYFPLLPDGTGKNHRTYLMLILDDYSRMAVGAKIFFSDNALNFQAVLKTAVATFGIPNVVYCDHGGPYDCNQTAFICADVGILLRHPFVRDSSAKGKIERMFRSVKERWLYGLDLSAVKSLDDMNRRLREHIREYNLTPHSSTGTTPMDRFLSTQGRIKAAPSSEWLDDRFMNRAKRKVGGDSTVRLEGVQWDAPMQFIGSTVEVRYLPGDGAAYISAGGERHHLRRTNKAENAKARRAHVPTIDYSKAGGIADV